MTPRSATRRRSRGFTVIELMVGLVVGLAIAVAAASVFKATGSSQRSTHATADASQAGTYVLQLLDRWVRSAGTGFAPAASYAYGCRLLASKSGTQILPRPAALPAPFGSVNTGSSGLFRLAPVVIGNSQTTPNVSGSGSDVLIVMGGSAGQAEAAMPFAALSQSSVLQVASTLGLGANDLLLVADQQPAASGPSDCLIEQVSSTFSTASLTSIDLAGNYYAATIGSVALTSVSSQGSVLGLGNVAAGNPPNFLIFGVGDNNTLYSYDLLQTSSTPLQPLADGVFELHALYAVDSDADGLADSWVAPTGTYALSAMLDGSSAAAAKLRSVKAIRIGLILRTTRNDATDTPAALTLFGDLGASLTYTRSLSSSERQYRYRTMETTVPLRNNLLVTP
jgi:type IV pilus assembly protein PilW